ncbi:hypothetical protein BC567DRAFT_226080 [Phyllosticta citribraziliensis]
MTSVPCRKAQPTATPLRCLLRTDRTRRARKSIDRPSQSSHQRQLIVERELGRARNKCVFDGQKGGKEKGGRKTPKHRLDSICREKRRKKEAKRTKRRRRNGEREKRPMERVSREKDWFWANAKVAESVGYSWANFSRLLARLRREHKARRRVNVAVKAVLARIVRMKSRRSI